MIDFQEQISSKSDQELLSIYVKPYEYQPEFVNQVLQELMKRGVSLEKYKQEKETKERLSTELLK